MAVAHKKRGPKFVNPTVKERVLADVARLRGFRYNQYEIAEKLGISQAQVSLYEKELRKRYAAVQFDETAALVAEKVAQYDDVIRQAAEAFERSKTRSAVDDKGRETVVEQTPEAVFLAKVMDALKAQRELLGLDAPTKQDVRAAVVSAEVKQADFAALRGRPPRSDVVAEVVAAERAALPEHKPGVNGTNGKAK